MCALFESFRRVCFEPVGKHVCVEVRDRTGDRVPSSLAKVFAGHVVLQLPTSTIGNYNNYMHDP